VARDNATCSHARDMTRARSRAFADRWPFPRDGVWQWRVLSVPVHDTRRGDAQPPGRLRGRPGSHMLRVRIEFG